MGFDKHGLPDIVFYGFIGGVKTLYMADLTFNIILFRRCDEFFGFGNGLGDGFFNKNVFALFDAFQGKGMMKWSRGNNIDDFYGVDQFLLGFKINISFFFRQLACSLDIRVIKTDQIVLLRGR